MTVLPHSDLDVATSTYQKAVQLFKKNFTKDDAKRKWLDSNNTLQDVQDAVSHAKSQYEAKDHGRIRTQLDRFSSGVIYYSGIMDMLVQHHPEYVSLAWGTLKLVFVLVTNHEQMISELSNAFSQISEALPRMEMHLYLYPTTEMQARIEELYALVIHFYQRALRWYKASGLKHALHSLIRPYQLEFEDIVRKVETRARSIDALAIALAHQEIRSMFMIIKDMREEQLINRGVQDRLLKASDVSHKNASLSLLQEIKATLISHQTVNSGILLNTDRSVREAQVALMIAATNSVLQTPYEALQRRIALARRQQGRIGVNMDEVWQTTILKNWSSGVQSSLLIVMGSLPTKNAVNLTGTCMVELIRSADVPVLWALKIAATADGSTNEVLKYIAMQALKLQPDKVSNMVSAQFNAARVASAESDEDWLQVFISAIATLPKVYLVVDAEILGETARDKIEMAAWLVRLMGLVQKGIGTIVKIAVLSYRRSVVRAALQLCAHTPRLSTLSLDKVAQLGSGIVHGHTKRPAFKSKGAVRFQKHVIKGRCRPV